MFGQGAPVGQRRYRRSVWLIWMSSVRGTAAANGLLPFAPARRYRVVCRGWRYLQMLPVQAMTPLAQLQVLQPSEAGKIAPSA